MQFWKLKDNMKIEQRFRVYRAFWFHCEKCQERDGVMARQRDVVAIQFYWNIDKKSYIFDL